ncbi:hypothetical protein [Alienimonas californiensis]|uniref:Preprotein translocase subunit SecD n=1 Tax=Alienimonas californiensis TaxID=2527989 RepID=A0A517P4P2_9PLAN|nr:hypothetical protein [Alienimonas californiensis]QDT14357.1 hypothetical protein CA12_04300 [Alienimonas californiensis]
MPFAAPLLLVAALAPADAQTVTADAVAPVSFAAFAMPDQFGTAHAVGGTGPGVTVLLYGDREAAEASRDLGAALHVLFHPTAKDQSAKAAAKAPVRPVPGAAAGAVIPPVHVVAAASAPGVPGPVRSVIAFQLRRAAPHTPVLLDWNADLARQFGLTSGAPNAVVISATGVGYPVDVSDEKAADRIEAAVETLRRRMTTTR